jgi:menaquinone-dependent protoporphyrinogen oxidase
VVNVLMAYATKNGSTQQVADAITVAMRERSAQVTPRQAKTVRESVAGFDLVVLGAPLYSGRWHRDAHRFLRRHRGELASVPVAVFGIGPRTDTEDAWQRSRAQLDRALAKRGWLDPVTVTVFGGVDPPGNSKRPPRDLRNWETIATWATQALTTVGETAKTVGQQASSHRPPQSRGRHRQRSER